MLNPPVRAAVFVATLPVRVLRLMLSATEQAPEPVPTEPRPMPSGGARVGKYDVALIELAAKSPGITVATAADKIGVPASGLYPTIRRLEGAGYLEKRGRGLHTA